MGAKKRPFYRVVVANSTSPRDGRFIDTIGHYNPCTDPPLIKIDEEKAKHWLACGAQPSDTAAALLKKQGLMARTAPRPVVESKTASAPAEAPAAPSEAAAPIAATSTAPAETPAVAAEVSAEPVVEAPAPAADTVAEPVAAEVTAETTEAAAEPAVEEKPADTTEA
jgi:small subunit ribosomal protein S16